MERPELVQRTLDYIKTTYKAEYEGSINITQNGTEYRLNIGLPSYMTPTSIACDANSDDEFMDFIEKEFRERNYMRVYFYRVNRLTEQREN
jgi:hypothetical protein